MISQERLQLGQSDIGRRLVGLHDQPGMRLDLHRTSIATLLLWRWRPMLICKLLPPDGARGADTEPYRSLPTRQTTRDRRHNSISKIYRQCSRHPRQPPAPA
jgi:hypothetical protein